MALLNEYSIGRHGLLFLTKHTGATFGEIVTADDPLAAHAHRVMSANLRFTHQRNNREDKDRVRTIDERWTGRRSGTFDVNSYLLHGGAGSKPDLYESLEAFFKAATGNTGGTAVNTLTVVNAATAQNADGLSTDIAITDADIAAKSLAVGDAVAIQGEDTDNYYMGYIVAVDAAPVGYDLLTVRPRIPFADLPVTAGRLIYRGSKYAFQENVVDSLTGELINDKMGFRLAGVVPNEVIFEGSGDGAVMVTINYLLGDVPYWGGIAEVINEDPGTAIAYARVNKGDGRRFKKGMLVTWWDNSADAYHSEKMTVGVITESNAAYDEMALTRGAGPLDADIGDQLVPYRPSGFTTKGTVISGALQLPGYGVRIQKNFSTPAWAGTTAQGDDFTGKLMNWKVTFRNNAELDNDTYGSDHAIGFKVGDAEVIVEMTIKARSDLFHLYTAGREFQNNPIMIQIGNTPGTDMMGLWLPLVEFDTPEVVDAGRNDWHTFTLSGMGKGTTAGYDSGYFLHV